MWTIASSACYAESKVWPAEVVNVMYEPKSGTGKILWRDLQEAHRTGNGQRLAHSHNQYPSKQETA
ncbi:hypothetical protein UB46_14020 [Burkholderiaceae bacterium 16]|nr:hypothetical protein UB46_14020 [Burkholderiaceae bacterium 16]